MGIAELEIAKEKGTSIGDRVLILLLSLNFVLLAFFILLNSMATYESRHGKAVLAKMREGYDIQGPIQGDGGRAPTVPMSMWQQGAVSRLQGLVINRLKLDTVPLEVDADRLVMTFPPGILVGNGKVTQPEMVRNIMTAAGSESRVVWEVRGDIDKGAGALAANAGALMALTERVVMTQGQLGEVRAVFLPGTATKAEVGGTLQRLSIGAGANDVRGERHGE